MKSETYAITVTETSPGLYEMLLKKASVPGFSRKINGYVRPGSTQLSIIGVTRESIGESLSEEIWYDFEDDEED